VGSMSARRRSAPPKADNEAGGLTDRWPRCPLDGGQRGPTLTTKRVV
jgi:hypothetical protein